MMTGVAFGDVALGIIPSHYDNKIPSAASGLASIVHAIGIRDGFGKSRNENENESDF
jgi:hypothetical protein